MKKEIKKEKTAIVEDTDGTKYEVNAFDDEDILAALEESQKELNENYCKLYNSFEEMWTDLFGGE